MKRFSPVEGSLEDGSPVLIEDEDGTYVLSSEYDALFSLWEARGEEIDRLFERLGKIAELAEG